MMNSANGYVSLEEIEEYNAVVNRTCRSEGEFYKFFNSYALSKGFSIRKDRRRFDIQTRLVIERKYSCSRQGYRRDDYFDRSDEQRAGQALSRCGCPAYLIIQKNKETGSWFVKDYLDKHNHPLAKPEHSFLLRSHRGLSDAQKCEAIELGLGGLRTYQIMDVMEKNHGGPSETGFIMQDLYNFFARLKKERVEGYDAEYVLSYLRSKKEQDSEFFFTYTVEGGHLQNLFWSDSQSQLDYAAFGDVVVFDSTYRVNRYNLPFVPFVGVDHHRGTVVYGCGIISDETTETYKWLLRAFLEAMKQKHPDSLITDGDAAMASAIESVMPGADHRLCSWHIEQRMVMHLRGEKLKEFRELIYHRMEVEEFERRWWKFVEDHDIKEDDLWFWRMYELRFKWSAAYTKGKKFLGMRSSQRSESLNSRLHKHLDRMMSLIDLVEHYEFCLLRIRRTQVERDGRALGSSPFTDKHEDPFVYEAAQIYTPKVFVKVKRHIKKLSTWKVTKVSWGDNDSMIFEVAWAGPRAHIFEVTCTTEGKTVVDASCSCGMLECDGIPCAHIFTALRSMKKDTIPPGCVIVRWTMQANCAFPVERVANTHVVSDQMERLRGLRNMAHRVLFKVSMSVEETERMMELLQTIENGYDDEQSSEGTFFVPLPAHFSGAHRPSASSMVLMNPKKIVSKGAPPTNKRLRSLRERKFMFETNTCVKF